MRVFILGTGRCGTKTAAAAAAHLTNYTSAHERTPLLRAQAPLTFPDQHIESDAGLTFLLRPLADRLPPGEAVLFVHLQRRRAEVVRSWVKRGPRIGPARWAPIGLRVKDATKLSPAQWHTACELCHDAMIGQIQTFLSTRAKSEVAHLWLHEAEASWPAILDRIGAEGDLAASAREWRTQHNATRK